VPFVAGAAILFQLLYLHLLVQAGVLQAWNWRSIGFVICSGLVSVVAAGGITSYLFPNMLTYYTGVDHVSNAPPIILNAALLSLLWWRARRGVRASA
jgi:hypothetical protein